MQGLTVGSDPAHNSMHRHGVTARGPVVLRSLGPARTSQPLRRWPLIKGRQKLFHGQVIIGRVPRLRQ
jgi:hypothetical protein